MTVPLTNFLMSYILQPPLQVLPKPLRIDPGRAVSTEQRHLLLLLHQNSLREVPWPPPPLPPAQPHTLPLPLLCTASPLSSHTPLRTTHSSVRYTVYSLLMFIVVFVDCVTAAVPCLLASLTFSWQSFYLLFLVFLGVFLMVGSVAMVLTGVCWVWWDVI